MYEIAFLFVLALVWLGFASAQDLRKREVYNWVSFSLVIFAMGFRFFYSLFSDSVGFGFLWQGLIGLAIFIALGNLLYYGRMFAGGDAKLMMALGAILGFSESFSVNLKIYVGFLFLFLLAGALYGLAATFSLSVRNFKEFKIDFKKRVRKSKKFLLLGMLLGVFVMFLGILQGLLFTLGILVFVFPYLYLYARSVDETCMIKVVDVSEISEGELITEKVIVGGKTILPNWEGLSLVEVNLIKKHLRKIKIRKGIPFVPVFFITFVVLLYLWNSNLWNAFW